MYGTKRGTGGGGGMGFGFRGSSPPWPYVGRGKGGQPRCSYYLSGAGAQPGTAAAYPASVSMTREQEISLLKNQADAIKQQLEQINARLQSLESTK